MVFPKRVYVIGAGGIGISAAAVFLQQKGSQVFGSDKVVSDITRRLCESGIPILQGEHPSRITSDVDLVLYSPAIPKDHPERHAAEAQGIPALSYPEWLGQLSRDYSTIAVTGTHGKSTTTALLGLLLEAAGYDPTVIVGSRVPGFPFENVRMGQGRFLVVEACEHQANFLHLHPEAIVLTNLEADHLDFYGSLDRLREAFQTFAEKVKGEGLLAWNADDAELRRFGLEGAVSFGKEQGTYRLMHREVLEGGKQEITLALSKGESLEELGKVMLSIPGEINARNFLAAFSLAHAMGVPLEAAKRVGISFQGLWRRFERVGSWKGAQVISDYGHHPTAIRETLALAREAFPHKRIVLVFQPHQHHRTQSLFKEFAEALSLADVLVLVEIYRVEGRTEEETLSSRDLASEVQKLRPDLSVSFVPDVASVPVHLSSLVEQDDIVLIQGAGDIDAAARALVSS